MASEIKVTASLGFIKGGAGDGISVPDLAVTLSGTKFLHGRQSIGTAEEALILGEVAAGGWLILVNRDATNFVAVKAASGATPLAKMKAGEPALFRLHPSATAPYLAADTAACEVEYLLLVD